MSKKPYVGIDGIQRPQNIDDRISLDVAAMLATPTGQSVMQYLKSITTDIANGPNISNDELRHLEGQRFIMHQFLMIVADKPSIMDEKEWPTILQYKKKIGM